MKISERYNVLLSGCFLFLCHFSMAQVKIKQPKITAPVQSASITIDNRQMNLTGTNAEIACSYCFVEKQLFLSFACEDKNIRLAVSFILPALETGEYEVYDSMPPGHLQLAPGKYPNVFLSEYILAKKKTYKGAYRDTLLQLTPLSLSIDTITNEVKNYPFIKRIKGHIVGTLASLQKDNANNIWHIEGNKTMLSGHFDVVCNMYPVR